MDRYLMYTNFLLSPKTVPCIDRDFYEWHNGIPYYGFWAVVVNDPDWIELYNSARIHVKQFVHLGYERLPHITITACGLLDCHHFSAEHFREQWRILNEMTISPFYLTIGSMNSFSSAPYLTVEDPEGVLKQIRDHLMVISKEDTPVEYQPHITLGLYEYALDTNEVADYLARFKYASIKPMLVNELDFCAYKTKEIQGPFKILKRVRLNSTEMKEKNHSVMSDTLENMYVLS